MRNSFVLSTGDDEEKSVLWIAKVLLLFCLKSHTESGGTAMYLYNTWDTLLHCMT